MNLTCISWTLGRNRHWKYFFDGRGVPGQRWDVPHVSPDVLELLGAAASRLHRLWRFTVSWIRSISCWVALLPPPNCTIVINEPKCWGALETDDTEGGEKKKCIVSFGPDSVLKRWQHRANWVGNCTKKIQVTDWHDWYEKNFNVFKWWFLVCCHCSALAEGRCLAECARGKYQSGGRCHLCDHTCATCVEAWPNNCTSCDKGEDALCLVTFR